MNEKIIPCGCLLCGVKPIHGVKACGNPAHFYIEIHMVDNCHRFDGGSSKASVCLPCFDSYSASVTEYIRAGMAGERPPKCQGTACDRYLTRPTGFWDVVEHAASHAEDLGEQ